MRRTWTSHCSPTLLRSPSEMERRLRTRDVALRIPTKNGTARIIYANTTNLLKETVRRHQLGARTHGHLSFLELVGSHLTFTSILAALQEGEERVVSRFTADNATVVTESLALGECRCYIRGDCNGSIDGAPFPLKVDRTLYGQSQPFSSMTAARLNDLVSYEESGVDLFTLCNNNSNNNDNNNNNNNNNNDDAIRQIPLALGLQDLPHDSLQEYFQYNISLHGYNFFRQSEGAAVALWCCSHLRDSCIQETLSQLANDAAAHSLDRSLELEAELEKRMGRAGCSYGVLVQPLVTTQAEEMRVYRVQRALLRASISTPDVFHELHRRAQEDGLACQDTLSLVSGDYEGAYAAALAARQFTQDPSLVAPVIDRIRQRLEMRDVRLQLEANSVVRNGLDFFCRCSKASFMQSVLPLPMAELVRLRGERNFHCSLCGKDHPLLQEDWEKLMQEKEKFNKRE